MHENGIIAVLFFSRLQPVKLYASAAAVLMSVLFHRDLGRLLRVNVMGYDYTGYGCCSSNGGPSVTATCSDVSAVLSALETIHGVKRKGVVLYGQSVGSGPTVSAMSTC
jgi:dienelactone hydrolase